MALRAAIAEQLRGLRLDRRLALALLLSLLGVGAGLSPRLRERLRAVLGPGDLWPLLPWGLLGRLQAPS